MDFWSLITTDCMELSHGAQVAWIKALAKDGSITFIPFDKVDYLIIEGDENGE